MVRDEINSNNKYHHYIVSICQNPTQRNSVHAQHTVGCRLLHIFKQTWN